MGSGQGSLELSSDSKYNLAPPSEVEDNLILWDGLQPRHIGETYHHARGSTALLCLQFPVVVQDVDYCFVSMKMVLRRKSMHDGVLKSFQGLSSVMFPNHGVCDPAGASAWLELVGGRSESELRNVKARC